MRGRGGTPLSRRRRRPVRSRVRAGVDGCALPSANGSDEFRGDAGLVGSTPGDDRGHVAQCPARLLSRALRPADDPLPWLRAQGYRRRASTGMRPDGKDPNGGAKRFAERECGGKRDALRDLQPETQRSTVIAAYITAE